ncbi:VOC family protein [Paenibacillus tarimensis]
MTMTTAYAVQLDCVRMRVRRLKPAIRFYSALFGWPVIQEMYNGEIYVFHMSDGRKLLLDDIRGASIIAPWARPAAVISVQHLGATHERAVRAGLDYVSEIENGVHCRYFEFRDNDGHEWWMADSAFVYPGTDGVPSEGPIKTVLPSVAVSVSDTRKAAEQLAAVLDISFSSVNDERESRGLSLPDGARIDFIPQLEGVTGKFPQLRLQTADLPASYRHLQAIGADLLSRSDEAERGQPIRLSDPDGHLLEVERS